MGKLGEHLKGESIICKSCKLPGEAIPGKKSTKCRECWRKYERERYKNNPKRREQVKAQSKALWADPKRRQARLDRINARRRIDPEARQKEIDENHKLKLKRLGLTLTDYERMIEVQEDCCAICLKPEIVRRLGRVVRLAIDHDHATGKIRGLLCCSCNRAIGMLRDSAENCRRAEAYLLRYAS